jgi:hypothetical protein
MTAKMDVVPLSERTSATMIILKYFGCKLTYWRQDGEGKSNQHGVYDKLIMPTVMKPGVGFQTYFVIDTDSVAMPRELHFTCRECDVEQHVHDLARHVVVESFCDGRAAEQTARPKISLAQEHKRTIISVCYYGVKYSFNNEAPGNYMIASYLGLASRPGCFSRVLSGWQPEIDMYREIYIECSAAEYKTVVFDEIKKYLKVVHYFAYNKEVAE